MNKIICNLTNKAYPIFIEENLLSDVNVIANIITAKRIVVITDDNVNKLYLQENLSILALAKSIDMVSLAPGEVNKQWAAVEKIFQVLLESNHDRDSIIIAIGGGVVGDTAGFAASCYMRGLRWVMMPTTLLAQVDAAVGGKTAINYDGHKNLIGSFYQPQAVVIDVNTLISLPKREYIAGLAEVIKYGIICDKDFFIWLENNYKLLLMKNIDAVKYAIKKSCELKAEIVAADEFEQGKRINLNFGHTVGHALEAATDFSKYLHGEAVAIGMIVAAKLSYKMKIGSVEVYERLISLIQNVGLPTCMGEMPYNKLLLHIKSDKKNKQGKWNFILPITVGKVVVNDKITAENLTGVL